MTTPQLTYIKLKLHPITYSRMPLLCVLTLFLKFVLLAFDTS